MNRLIRQYYTNGSGFVHGGSGPLTVYSDDEKAAINALTDADDDTYYLFLVNSVTKLDADGNNTVVSGYMPVGYQHGFIFEQFNVARTFAHELSHGAFALHHTFSANTESFRADEGTTTNLMDYTEHGATLNHKQWTWMHEKHGAGLFGFLADESESESVLDNLVHYYLHLISDANANNKNELNLLVENGSIETNEKYRGEISYVKMHLDGGLEKLQPAKIDLFKQNIKKTTRPKTEYDVTIDPRERTVETDGTEFVKYSFHKLVNGENTRDIAIQILVKKNESDWLEYYLYGSVEYKVNGVPFYSQFDTVIDGLNCHWCAKDGKCCDGKDKTETKDKEGKLVSCAEGTPKSNNCCGATAKYMITQSGNTVGNMTTISDFFVRLKDDKKKYGGVYSNADISNNANLNKAKDKIKQGIPLLAGVYYDMYEIQDFDPGPNNTINGVASPSAHFIVLVGYGINDKGEYFLYYNPGTSQGGSTDNKLFFDTNENIIKGTPVKNVTDRDFILTEIRL